MSCIFWAGLFCVLIVAFFMAPWWGPLMVRVFARALGWLRQEFFYDFHAVLHGIAALAAAGTIGYFLPHQPRTVTVEREITVKCQSACGEGSPLGPAAKPPPTPEQLEAAAHKEEIIVALRNMERGRKICVDHHHEVRWFLKCYAAGGNEFEGFENDFYDARGRHKKGKSSPCEKDMVVCDKWLAR